MNHRKTRDPNVNYHKPVCVKCQCELKPEWNGIGVLDYFNPSDSPEPKPYEIWDADLWKCPKCGYELVVGFGDMAIYHHHDDGFGRALEGYKANARLIECR